MPWPIGETQLDERFKILNREAGLMCGLLTAGLESLRKVSKDKSYYYQSFYSLSVGFERLMKLILYLENPSINLRSFNHDLERLKNATNITFDVDNISIENKLIVFLNHFANSGRYNIVDYFSSGNSSDLVNEPIIKFYNDVFVEIISLHPPRLITAPLPVDFVRILHISEDLSEINDLNDLMTQGQLVNHASKYAVMYFGRLLQPFLEKLGSFDGPPDNPHFSEHFRYLRQNDSYFKNRKTFRP